MSDSQKPPLNDARTWSLMRRLLREAVKPYLPQLFFAVIFMVLVAGSTAATAWLLEPAIDQVFVAKDPEMLWLVGIGVIGVFVLKSISSFGQESLIAYVGQRIIADMQNRLFDKLLRQDVGVFQDKHTGALISHFTYDINAMRGAVANAIVGLGRDALSVIFLVALMFYQDWVLASIAFVVAPLSAWPIERLGKVMRRVSGETQEEMGHLTTTLSQSFQGIRMIKAYALESYERSKVGELVEKVFQLTFHAAKVRAVIQPIIDTLGGFAIAGVIIYGGARAIEGETTAGAFISFIGAVIMAYQPLRGLGKVNAILQEGLAAADRIFTILDRPATILEAPEPKAIPRDSGAVRFEQVAFAYNDDGPALNGVSFEAPAGGVTALVGPSGAGKSTVLSLIPRFYDPKSGVVRVNGCDVTEASFESLRNCLALVSQEVTLFDDTVAANIRFGRQDAALEDVQAAAKAAAAHDFIQALPQGYDTIVGEHGLKLSGGQRQRLAIARAILKDAPILLLDEATSALDTESERQIQAALEQLMEGRTTIVIAHRLSTITHADVIHVFDQGQVVESGAHEALLAEDGLYARLHSLQFGKSEEA